MLRLLALTVSLSLAASTSLANDNDNSFCRGFIIKALDEYSIEGAERIDLWLGWNATVIRTGSQGKLNETEYKQGRDSFDNRFSSGGAASVLAVRNEDCDMGRDAGWRWW